MKTLHDIPSNQSLLQRSADERYQFFLETVVRTGEVWSLRSRKGWVMMSSDAEECLPVWPTAELASDWIEDDWSDCSPVSIPLGRWLDRWLPGMRRDGIALAVFPNMDEEGMVVGPEVLRDDLKLELDCRQTA